MADPKTCTGFLPNPAVFGLGVRIGFYAIGLLSAIAPVKWTFSRLHYHEAEEGGDPRPTKEISSTVTVQGVNGLGLLLTAVIQTKLGLLSLYHAFLIINLLFLLSTSFIYFLVNPYSQLKRRYFFSFALVLLAIFALYIGLNARTFGSQPECNGTIQIVWILRISTASFAWFKVFGIAIFSIYMAVAAFHVFQLTCWKRTRLGRMSSRASNLAVRGYGLFVLTVNLLLIAVIEVTIRSNNVPDNTEWSFGQTLPLVMLIVPICDIWDDNFPLIKATWLRSRAPQRYSSIDKPWPMHGC